MPGQLEEDIRQQDGGGISAGEKDVDYFKTEDDRGANPFREFVKEDVSAVWAFGGRVLLLSGRIRGQIEGAVNVSVDEGVKLLVFFGPGFIEGVAE